MLSDGGVQANTYDSLNRRVTATDPLGRMERYRKKRTGETVPLAAEEPNHVWCPGPCFEDIRI